MTIYSTRNDTDTFHHLVTDDFHVLQQLRVQPAPCKCLLRDDAGPWEWVTQDEAARLLEGWHKAASRAAHAPAPAPAAERRRAA